MFIYKTTNLVNGKIYVGKNSTCDPYYLGGGKLLKQAIKKYGRKNFKREIVETCLTITELNEQEKFWIQHFNSTNKLIGYNILVGGETSPMERNKHTDETKIKMSLNHVDVSGTNNPMYGKTFFDAWVEQGLSTEDIEIKKINWLKKRSELSQGSNNGMHGVSRYGVENPFYGKTHSEQTKLKLSKIRKKPILQFTLSGEFIREWESGKDVIDTLKINPNNCCNGISKTACGFVWRFKT